MQSTGIPAKFPIPFASAAAAANVRTIPQTSQQGVQNGAASLTDGFPPNCFAPISAGGSWPFGQDFNGLLKQVTQWLQWNAAGAPIKYDSAFSSAIGGYPQGALISSATLGSFWLSTVDNNTSNPDTGGANWLSFPFVFTRRFVFTASTTFTYPAGALLARVRLWAGGGGGGGTSGAGSVASGGGGAGFAEGVFSVTQGANVAVTVGSGGFGGVGAAAGGGGGSSSFGSLISASPGGGGAGAGAGVIATTPGGGGTGFGGSLSLPGYGGGTGVQTATGSYMSGSGGGAFQSQGAQFVASNSSTAQAGGSGLLPGAGGSGGISGGGGGGGARGLIIVEC